MKYIRIVCLFTIMALLVLAGRTYATEQDQSPGAAIYIKNKCQSCHSVLSNGIGSPKKATAEEDDGWGDDDDNDKGSPDLSGAGLLRDSEWMHLWLRKKVANEKGKKHMKRFKGTDEERQILVDWLLTLKTSEAESK